MKNSIKTVLMLSVLGFAASAQAGDNLNRLSQDVLQCTADKVCNLSSAELDTTKKTGKRHKKCLQAKKQCIQAAVQKYNAVKDAQPQE